MIDVFHHLEFPSLALQEIKKILIREKIKFYSPAMNKIDLKNKSKISFLNLFFRYIYNFGSITRLVI
jgi:hypothetical protein